MSNERDSVSEAINRRLFMRRAGMTAAGVAVAAAGTDSLLESHTVAQDARPLLELDPEGLHKPDRIPKENILTGEILSIGVSRFVIEPVESGSIEIELAPNAHIDREGPALMSAYSPGDEVVVLGVQRGRTFMAVGVAPLFQVIDATLYSRKGSLLNTSEGKILLTPTTTPGQWVGRARRAEERPLADLKPGDEIRVMGLVNQKSHVMTANRIGVVVSDRSSSYS